MIPDERLVELRSIPAGSPATVVASWPRVKCLPFAEFVELVDELIARRAADRAATRHVADL